MLWLVLGVLMQAAQAVPDLQLHHVHIKVADQAAAMNAAAERLDGQRLILQGHGPAVRAADRYVVFDLADTAAPDGGFPRSSAYDEALRWMRSHGLSVATAAADVERLASETPHGRVGVVAFSSPAPRTAIDALRATGVEPVEKTTDTARYRVSADLTIEIVSETDRPDTHWCPMHPAVRAAGASKCPLCGMDMVPIPPPKVGEYALDVAATQGTDKGRGVTLRLAVRDPQDGAVVTSFLNVHERPFHLFIVSRDLSTFVHAHPEQRSGGVFALDQALAPGEYMLIADFLPSGGTPQIVHRAIVTPGYSGSLFNAGRTDGRRPSGEVGDSQRDGASACGAAVSGVRCGDRRRGSRPRALPRRRGPSADRQRKPDVRTARSSGRYADERPRDPVRSGAAEGGTLQTVAAVSAEGQGRDGSVRYRSGATVSASRQAPVSSSVCTTSRLSLVSRIGVRRR
jgi:hypothetical protein